MVIFSKVRLGVTPDINALATIMVLIVATGIAISHGMDAAPPAAPRSGDMQLAARARNL